LNSPLSHISPKTTHLEPKLSIAQLIRTSLSEVRSNDLIFYEVIDGNRVYIQALLEVFDVYKLELTEDDIIRKVKSYMVI